MDRIRNAGQNDLHFVSAGLHRIEQPQYFRLEGPVTLIAFGNTERPGIQSAGGPDALGIRDPRAYSCPENALSAHCAQVHSPPVPE